MLLVHGHRGARAVFPENTLPGFQYAISAGADFVELDVAITADDIPVLSHDPILPSGDTIRALPFDALRQAHPSIPTLDEVLALEGIGFNVEMKSYPEHPEFTPAPARCAELLLAAIHRRQLESRVIVESFDFRILTEMKRQAPEIRLAALLETAPLEVPPEAQILAPEYHLLTPDAIAAAHARGIEVIPWTVNEPAGWQRLAQAGVDGIITDDPAALIEWLTCHGMR
jgi:glycerophosphoryl diester phosphodiesterase